MLDSGKVYLVGAGPGDPGLLTLRGKECLEMADIVVHDGLANPAFLGYAPNAEYIDVRKVTKNHTLTQEEISALIVREAKAGKRVVRLKGGDPFVFARGGEEAMALAEAGAPFEIVPGITSANAAPEYAGIPITQRGVAQSYSVITGHASDGNPVDLNKLGIEGTLIFLMAMRQIEFVMKQCIDAGRPASTPAAVVEWATYPRQRTIIGTLEDIAQRCADAEVESPAVIIVGEAVRAAEPLAWFSDRPLFGLRIAVTRAQIQAGSFSKRLIDLGADVFEFPTIAIEEPTNEQDFGYIGDYDWVVLTSVNAVNMLFDSLERSGLDARDLAGVKLCVVGAATARAVQHRYLNIDLAPDEYTAEAMMDALKEHGDIMGKRFLLPRADIARSFLPEALREHGAEVVETIAYRTVKPEGAGENSDALLQFKPQLITFTSSSTARNFADLFGAERVQQLRDAGCAFGSIGPLTTETAERMGMPIAVEPAQHDIPNFVDAILAWHAGHAG